MRVDPSPFTLADTRASRKPRFVIKIEYDVESVYCTSHDDITGVPGVVLQRVVQRPAAISQKLFPDDGRSEIGSFEFAVVDKAKALTAELRSQLLDNGQGIRRRKAQFWVGYQNFAFADFQLFTTQIVTGCSFSKGLYTIECADITREQRKEVFRPVSTTLTASVDATTTNIPVNDTSKFETVTHGPSYSDAPNLTVGYFRLEDEIVRWTAKTGTAFTGCTRGVFNTRAVAHNVDATTPVSRRTKVEEFIYLEMPGPPLAYAVMTGVQYGTANTLPAHWHLGIDTGLVRLTDFENIGTDLWVKTNDADLGPLVFRLDGLKAQDGKTFLEKQIYLLLNCYSPIYSDGTIGLKRMTPVISDAAPVVTLTADNIVSLSDLRYDLDGMHNIFRISWGYDAIREEFIRETFFFDEESMLAHQSSAIQKYAFLGLHSQRATDATVSKKLDGIRDRYAEPPYRIKATVLGSLNRVEVGDIVRIKVPEDILRDFTKAPGEYNRSFEIQQKSYQATTGELSLDLFGSTTRPVPLPIGPGDTPFPLPDAFYNSVGTALTSIITVTGGIASTGSFTLTGNASLTNSGAVFYYLGDLTIPNGCNITLAANVQLRVRGFLTLNGTINGVGGGRAGVSDPGTGAWDATFSGNPGFVGNSRGWDGIRIKRNIRVQIYGATTIPAVMTVGRHPSIPSFELKVSGNTLLGLPDDLRGTGGAPGGRIIDVAPNDDITVVAPGDAGANGGAGLCIICRGMSIGGSGSITLSGANSTVASVPYAIPLDEDAVVYPGAGGVGGPGAWLLLMDGNTLAIPEITPSNFIARSGTLTQPGVPMERRADQLFNPGAANPLYPATDSGFADPDVVSNLDYSSAVRGLQFVPDDSEIPDDNPDYIPDAPTNLVAGTTTGGNLLNWTNPDPAQYDQIVIYASIDNDRTNAVEVGETRASTFTHPLPLGGRYYYWIRSRFDPSPGRPLRFSTFEPPDADAGVSSNASAPGEISESPADFTASGRINGIQFNWTLPWAKLMGKIQIYEHTAATPFEAAVPVWEGYALGAFVPRSSSSTRYYWLVLNRNGAFSAPLPSLAGLPAAPVSVSGVLSAYAEPGFMTVVSNLSPPDPKTITTVPCTAVASGGTGPYTYLWQMGPGGSLITIDSPFTPTTTFSSTSFLNGTNRIASAFVTITDSLGATATWYVTTQFSWPSIA